MNEIKVFLETGDKRVFASAVDWPGWSRGGQDESSALQALVDYAPRYARALQPSAVAFQPPTTPSVFQVVERQRGGSSTDFGSLGVVPQLDYEAVGEAEQSQSSAILAACWQTLLDIVRQTAGAELRTGPRGGGRSQERILTHILEAQQAYLGRIGWKQSLQEDADIEKTIRNVQQSVLDGFAACARGELPRQGPRGGQYWPARYFARRSAWHILDHAWEIEDRRL